MIEGNVPQNLKYKLLETRWGLSILNNPLWICILLHYFFGPTYISVFRGMSINPQVSLPQINEKCMEFLIHAILSILLEFFNFQIFDSLKKGSEWRTFSLTPALWVNPQKFLPRETDREKEWERGRLPAGRKYLGERGLSRCDRKNQLIGLKEALPGKQLTLLYLLEHRASSRERSLAWACLLSRLEQTKKNPSRDT